MDQKCQPNIFLRNYFILPIQIEKDHHCVKFSLNAIYFTPQHACCLNDCFRDISSSSPPSLPGVRCILEDQWDLVALAILVSPIMHSERKELKCQPGGDSACGYSYLANAYWCSRGSRKTSFTFQQGPRHMAQDFTRIPLWDKKIRESCKY